MSFVQPQAANLGFPRISADETWPAATRMYLEGVISAEALYEQAAALRARHWRLQAAAGIEVIPSGDFSLFDHVLDTTAFLGAIPSRFGTLDGLIHLDQYFAMALGQGHVAAMSKARWFGTPYHYVVPELAPNQQFQRGCAKALTHYLEAKALGIETRPVLLGPLTWLALARSTDPLFEALSLLPKIIPIYQALLADLKNAGAAWVQIDEPILAGDLSVMQKRGFTSCYAALADAGPQVMLVGAYGALAGNLDLAVSLPVAGLHLDLQSAPEELARALAISGDKLLSLGLIDGRNIWRADLQAAFALARRASGRGVQIAPSSSLMHLPLSLEGEDDLPQSLRPKLAFAYEKLQEVSRLTRALRGEDLGEAPCQNAQGATRPMPVQSGAENALTRSTPRALRFVGQRAEQAFPAFPTTLLEALPRHAVLSVLKEHRGTLTAFDCAAPVPKDTAARQNIEAQAALGLDVLADPTLDADPYAQYALHLEGVALPKRGWVQSFGLETLRPPIIFGDLARQHRLKSDVQALAKALPHHMLKAQLIGPITLMKHAFCREDRTPEEIALQLALVLRDELADLEAAGLHFVQIDEPALTDALPARREEWVAHLEAGIAAFRLACSGAGAGVQIHCRLSGALLPELLPALPELDADVLHLQLAGDAPRMLAALDLFSPEQPQSFGLWDDCLPSDETVLTQLRRAVSVIARDQLWVVPDFDVKITACADLLTKIRQMTAAARAMRSGLPTPLPIREGWQAGHRVGCGCGCH